jgi:hypothetical protein
MNDLEKRIRALEARVVPAYCPDAAGFRLRDNYDFGVNIERIDQLADAVYDKLPYPGAEDHLPSNREYERYRPIGAGFHQIDTDVALLRLIARPTMDGKDLIIGSAMIRPKETVRDYFVECRWRVLGGPTVWPALWDIPANGSVFPEVDWVDTIRHQDPTRETPAMIHLGVRPADGQTEHVDLSLLDQWSNYHLPNGKRWDKDFIVSGGLRQGDTVAHFVDGLCVRRGTLSRLTKEGVDAGPSFLTLNLAIGGFSPSGDPWPGQPTDATFTERGGTCALMEIDYLRLYVP